MATETIDALIGDDMARIEASVSYLGTDTDGGRNTTRYAVEIAGHSLDGRWDGDARHATTVRIPAGSPLAPALARIAAMQSLRSTEASRYPGRSSGWTYEDWMADVDARAGRYHAAKAAVEADPLCRTILGLD